jgi:hypothetical protein
VAPSGHASGSACADRTCGIRRWVLPAESLVGGQPTTGRTSQADQVGLGRARTGSGRAGTGVDHDLVAVSRRRCDERTRFTRLFLHLAVASLSARMFWSRRRMRATGANGQKGDHEGCASHEAAHLSKYGRRNAPTPPPAEGCAKTGALLQMSAQQPIGLARFAGSPSRRGSSLRTRTHKRRRLLQTRTRVISPPCERSNGPTGRPAIPPCLCAIAHLLQIDEGYGPMATSR